MERRNKSFHLNPDKVLDWNKNGVFVSQIFNTLSIFFPAGERFFIDSVRSHRHKILDTELFDKISVFIGQEGFHSREHDIMNECLVEAGMPVKELEEEVIMLLDKFRKHLPERTKLAMTSALEHMTALLADGLLSDPRYLEGSDPSYKAMWEWHALEEIEHKAVAFDVYKKIYGDGALTQIDKTVAFSIVNLLFWAQLANFYRKMIAASGLTADVRGWKKTYNTLFGEPGLFRKMTPKWVKFLSPEFHPNNFGGDEHLSRIDDILEQVG